MSRFDGREVEEGQRSPLQPCIDLYGDHDHNRVSERNDDDDTLLLSPRDTG